MKRVSALLIALIALTSAPLSHASDPYDSRNVQQGSTAVIEIPRHDDVKPSGKVEDELVYFYPIEREPAFDEPIPRAKFLELMFLNGEFPDIETEEAISFPDVPEDYPEYEYIQKAAALGIIHGYEDGLFRPETTITRGQIAKVLVEAFDPPLANNEPQRFADIPNNHRFYDYINRAVSAAYFQGYPDGFMRPDRDINFDEARIVIQRAAQPEQFTPLDPQKYWRAFVGIHRLSSLETKRLIITNGDEQKTIDLNVTERDFPVISFSMSEDKTALFADDDQAKTWAAIDAAKAHPTDQQLWDGPFILPTDGELTLGFGDKLYINGAYSGSHFGLDLANTEGTPVYASNTGKVVLSAWTPSYGNTIVIDHGQNVYTMYLHMSALVAEEGQSVQKGDLIGRMGSTGIATGSHLHFTHFIGGIIVDSQPWMDGVF